MVNDSTQYPTIMLNNFFFLKFYKKVPEHFFNNLEFVLINVTKKIVTTLKTVGQKSEPRNLCWPRQQDLRFCGCSLLI